MDIALNFFLCTSIVCLIGARERATQLTDIGIVASLTLGVLFGLWFSFALEGFCGQQVKVKEEKMKEKRERWASEKLPKLASLINNAIAEDWEWDELGPYDWQDMAKTLDLLSKIVLQKTAQRTGFQIPEASQSLVFNRDSLRVSKVRSDGHTTSTETASGSTSSILPSQTTGDGLFPTRFSVSPPQMEVEAQAEPEVEVKKESTATAEADDITDAEEEVDVEASVECKPQSPRWR